MPVSLLKKCLHRRPHVFDISVYFFGGSLAQLIAGYAAFLVAVITGITLGVVAFYGKSRGFWQEADSYLLIFASVPLASLVIAVAWLLLAYREDSGDNSRQA